MVEFFAETFISMVILSVIIFTAMITLCFVAKMIEEIVMAFRRMCGKKTVESKAKIKE